MNPEQFYKKVKACREAQRRYYKNRDSRDLIKARQLEKELDAEIARVEDIRKMMTPKDQPQQLRIFTKGYK
jgi:hypothetical protein